MVTAWDSDLFILESKHILLYYTLPLHCWHMQHTRVCALHKAREYSMGFLGGNFLFILFQKTSFLWVANSCPGCCLHLGSSRLFSSVLWKAKEQQATLGLMPWALRAGWLSQGLPGTQSRRRCHTWWVSCPCRLFGCSSFSCLILSLETEPHGVVDLLFELSKWLLPESWAAQAWFGVMGNLNHYHFFPTDFPLIHI